MITAKHTDQEVVVQCTEIALPEFPDLKFGDHPDGSRYFDATAYLSAHPSDKIPDPELFLRHILPLSQSLVQAGYLTSEQIANKGIDGHQLINGYFCYLFLSFVDPQFYAYINESIDEMFTTGIAVSDTRLIALVKKRLSPELLKQIADAGNKN